MIQYTALKVASKTCRKIAPRGSSQRHTSSYTDWYPQSRLLSAAINYAEPRVVRDSQLQTRRISDKKQRHVQSIVDNRDCAIFFSFQPSRLPLSRQLGSFAARRVCYYPDDTMSHTLFKTTSAGIKGACGWPYVQQGGVQHEPFVLYQLSNK